MFSMLLATASDTVPSSHPARDRLPKISSRAPASSVRWNMMVLRM